MDGCSVVKALSGWTCLNRMCTVWPGQCIFVPHTNIMLIMTMWDVFSNRSGDKAQLSKSRQGWSKGRCNFGSNFKGYIGIAILKKSRKPDWKRPKVV